MVQASTINWNREANHSTANIINTLAEDLQW